ncbi:unnamed protein product [Phytomonas sp. EM1]|nr:unnamed protein product [Phytomonas sp. EM1]|eukprot:CCW60390.1 unnamed protein product [Phytomonas sp. isolate EM1]
MHVSSSAHPAGDDGPKGTLGAPNRLITHMLSLGGSNRPDNCELDRVNNNKNTLHIDAKRSEKKLSNSLKARSSTDKNNVIAEDGILNSRSSDSPQAARRARSRSQPTPTYHRIVTKGDEGDTEFISCAELIAQLIQARNAYKSIDKGQKVVPFSLNEFKKILNLSLPPSEANSISQTLQNRACLVNDIEALQTAPGEAVPFSLYDTKAVPCKSELNGADIDGVSEKHHHQTSSPALSNSSWSTNAPLTDGCGNFLVFEGGLYSFKDMASCVIPWQQYINDMRLVYQAIEFGPCLSTARTRLTTLAEKTQLYLLLNGELECNYDMYQKGGGVYARCAHVDNAVRLKWSVTASVLLNSIVRTAIEQPRTPLIVDRETDEVVSIKEYLQLGGVTNAQELTIEGLGLHPTLYRNKFIPYDMFDESLNPAGKFGSTLLQAVWSTSGPNQGDLCGALIRAELEDNEYKTKQIVATEMLIELYGHHPDEMRQLAAWMRRQGFNKFANNRWILNFCRERPPTETSGSLQITCQTVGDQLQNFFQPLMLATLYPTDPRWADIAQMLDCTGAISVQTGVAPCAQGLLATPRSPDTIPYDAPVSDYYFFYYVWANVSVLNALRTRVGLETLKFNPAVNALAPMFDQLVCGFLLGDVVYHASSLEKSWIMQYLFMICRIGVVMSPLRDNALRVSYFDHSFVKYFHQGLLVSLCTFEPLYFHHRQEQPLLEEYATLMKLRSLSPMDMCELARNSVLNSSFPESTKRQWLGTHHSSLGSVDNEMSRTNVCRYRLQFRVESFLHEEALLQSMLDCVAKRKGKQPFSIRALSDASGHQVLAGAAALHTPDLQHLNSFLRVNYMDKRIVYPRIDIYSDSDSSRRNPKIRESVQMLRHSISLRGKYNNFANQVETSVEEVFTRSNQLDEENWEYNRYYDVFLLSRVGKSTTWPTFIPTVQEFIHDVESIRRAVSARSLQCLAVHRLNLLERKFLLHLSMNIFNEAGAKEEKSWNNRDFFTAHKVDTNVQTNAGHNARTMLEFFVDKAYNHGDDVVFEENEVPITLRQLLSRYKISVDQITVDELQHQINTHDDLHDIFLSPHNFMQGRYFAELTKKTLQLFQEDAFTFVESRLMLSGASHDEWQNLAAWFDRYGMASSLCRWVVSIPRQYRRLRQEGKVESFGKFLDNIFRPLWEVSLHPAKNSKLHYFLAYVTGFDCVEDESKVDLPLTSVYPYHWRSDLNPPYNFYLYYLWANITSLNEFRASRGLGTFTFRPQCGEQGSMEHLIGGFLLANGINHGVTLAKHPVLEYMYYLSQLGIAMSPLSNTANVCGYLENPFPTYFHRGLNVSLATNKPLYFHFTREPLMEEYFIAAKLWRLEYNDLSEIARNSVLQCGFPTAWKVKALGPLYQLRSTLGNDVRKSRVSDIRVAFRYETYHSELNFLDEQLSYLQRMPRAMNPLEKEVVFYKAVQGQKSESDDAPEQVKPSDDTKTPLPQPSLDVPMHLNEPTTDINNSLKNKNDKDGRRISFSMPSVSSSDSSSSPKHLAKYTEALKADIAALDKELKHLYYLSVHLNEKNSAVASEVVKIRAQLKADPLVIMGGLAHDDRDGGQSDDEQPDDGQPDNEQPDESEDSRVN